MNSKKSNAKDTKKDKLRENTGLTGKTIDSSEKKEDLSLRPKSLKELSKLGRSDECESLNVLIKAAKERSESVDHILFYGPPGLGKTTFANVVASEMRSQIRITSGPAIERQGDLAAILTNLKRGDVLFIDEIHRLRRSVEEVLYPAMEDFKIDIVVGKGPSARSIRLKLAKFTLVGATTRAGLLSSPLRDRFGFIQRLDFFTVEDLKKIVIRASSILNVEIDEEAAEAVAKRSRGTARIALRLLKRVRDYAQVMGKNPNGEKSESRGQGRDKNGVITGKVAEEALQSLGVDELGLDSLDRKILSSIINKFNGGPVGLSTISAAVSEDVDTISEVYEPFLMQIGLIKRTQRGRVATQRAFEHLEIELPEDFDGDSDDQLKM